MTMPTKIMRKIIRCDVDANVDGDPEGMVDVAIKDVDAMMST